MQSSQCILKPTLYNSRVSPPAVLQDSTRFNNNGVHTNITWTRLPSGLWVRSFNGATSDVTVVNSRSLRYLCQSANQNLTVIIWAKVTPPDADSESLIGIADIGTGTRQWYIAGYTGANANHMQVVVSDDGTTAAGHWKQYYTNNAVFDGIWHMYSFTWGGGVLDLQVDGVSQAVTKPFDNAITTLYPSASNLSIGCLLNTGVKFRYMACDIGDIGIHTWTWSVSAILEYYFSTRRQYK